jgi:hypothetical protein
MFDALVRLFMHLGGGVVLFALVAVVAGMLPPRWDGALAPGEAARRDAPRRAIGTARLSALLAVCAPVWLAPLVGYLIAELQFLRQWGQAQTMLDLICLFAIPALGALGVARMGQFRTGWTMAGLVYYPIAWAITLLLGFLGGLLSSRSAGL